MSSPLTIHTTLAYETIDCYKCGVTFAVAASLRANWVRDKTQFFCPNGHSQSYAENEADRLRKQLTTATAEVDRQRQLRIKAEQRMSAQIAVNTKLRKRMNAGVCPHCHRTVSQMARHIKSKHPEVHTTPPRLV
jgi:hypothetical protein